MNPKKIVRVVLPGSTVKTAEETYRKSRIKTLQMRYGYPARDLRIIAVTGTNGKTTTCCFINEMLKSAGYRTAMFTTAAVEVDGEHDLNKRHRTVPVTAELLRFFKDAKEKEIDYVVLEVTSHALHQHKVLDIPIEVSVMTNLSQDHLDYHGTMDEYAAMKARLFNSYLKPTYCVLNRDDSRYKYYEKQSVGLVDSYGTNRGCSVQFKDVRPTTDGSRFTVVSEGEKAGARINLAGELNIYNAIAAATVGKVLGLSLKQVAKGIEALQGVAGRMEPVEAGQKFSVFVDYAVTPDALEKALLSLKERGEGKLHLVFGATGDRDKDKRPMMGEIAAKNADHIYLTDDETYTEDPDGIREQVMQGIKLGKGAPKTKEIADRKDAIAAALKAAKKGDIVYVTGIGHQDSRNMGGTLEPWNEVEVITTLLKNSKK